MAYLSNLVNSYYTEGHGEDAKFHKEKPMPIVYKEVKIDHGCRIDLLVKEKAVIEIKTVEAFNDVHTAQILLI